MTEALSPPRPRIDHPEELEKMVRQIVERVGPVAIYLFGSRGARFLLSMDKSSSQYPEAVADAAEHIARAKANSKRTVVDAWPLKSEAAAARERPHDPAEELRNRIDALAERGSEKS
jgi:hypothetical protein